MECPGETKCTEWRQDPGFVGRLRLNIASCTHKYVPSHRKNDGIKRAAFPVLTYVEMHSANTELANELKRSVARRAQDAMIGGSSSHLHSHAEGATLLCADTHADGTFTTD